MPEPLGYSLAGMVLEAAPDVSGLRPGDPVACAGAGYANHAEAVWVPANLAAPVPVGVRWRRRHSPRWARSPCRACGRPRPTLGEWVAVIGLGLVGQLAVQLLKADGCRVVAIDLDPKKVQLAESLGADLGLIRHSQDELQAVLEVTEGFGIDAALVTAATRSNDPVVLAGELCRDRGRVVVLGKVDLEFPWTEFYHKELEIRLSRSYGPGRYDPAYEEGGNDYPIGYVRWTENRNMAGVPALRRLRQVPRRATDHPSVPVRGRRQRRIRHHRGRAAGAIPGDRAAVPGGRPLPGPRDRRASMGGLGDDGARPVRAGLHRRGQLRPKTMLLPRPESLERRR